MEENVTSWQNELFEDLRTGKMAIFCGAGISYKSGLPVVRPFLCKLFDMLSLTDQEKKSILGSETPFENILELISQETDISLLKEVFGLGQPNRTHRLIAALMKEGCLGLICTTNFDSLIEQALEDLGLIEGKDYDVFRSGINLSSYGAEINRPTIIKIHGCCRYEESIAITLAALANLSDSEERKSVLSNIFDSSAFKHVLVLGYSCSDFDLVPHMESFANNKVKISYISHSHADTIAVNPIAGKIAKNPFRNYPGYEVVANTDNLVELIYKEFISLNIPAQPAGTTGWEELIEDWYWDTVDNLGEASRHIIASRLFYSIAEFQNAIRHHLNSIAIATKTKNDQLLASEKGNLAMAYNAVGDVDSCIKYLKQSIPMLKVLNDTASLCSQLQMLGSVHHRMGKNSESVMYYQEALAFAQKSNNSFGASAVLGEMCSPLIRLGKVLEAKARLEHAMEISKSRGFVQMYSSQLGIMAQAEYFDGNASKAIELIQEGIRLKKLSGDIRGLGNLYTILANICANQNQASLFKASISNAREIALKTKDDNLQAVINGIMAIGEINGLS
jgi:tetratricopeptide (TPR) repeat protein